MYIEFIFVGNMQCGYKELRLLRTFSCGHLGLLYPESTVYIYLSDDRYILEVEMKTI